MKYRICTLLLLCGWAASADPVITLDAPGGVIAGAPGDTIGWGFTVTSDPAYLTTFVTSFTLFETNPSIGFYTDFIGAQGGPENFTLPAGAPDWVQTFDPVQQTGMGSFAINPGALPGAIDSGVIHIEYEMVLASSSFSPFAGSTNCGVSCFASVELPFAVTVSAPAPEPATCVLEVVGLVLVGIGRKRRWGGPARRKAR